VCETISLLERSYECPDELETVLIDFLEELVVEKLLIPVDTDGEARAPNTEAVVTRAPFDAPVLEKYTDMQDLVLLDPVHDFDAAEGWPRLPHR
jgi:hypothetical protein